MAIKSILCIFGGLESELNALSAAMVLAQTHGAHVRVLHVSSDPSAYVGLYGEGIIASAAIIESIEKENKARLERAKQYVISYAAKHRIPLDTPEPPERHASASFAHLVGMIDTTIAREGRLCDLIIVGRQKPMIHDLVTPALFDTGRPVLMIPDLGGKALEWQDKTVALAWDGSVQAARALYNALPLLGRVEKLYILTAQESGKVFDLEAESSVMRYVQSHGLHVQGIAVATGQRGIPDSLLARAKELKSDFLVMGAYGHSMFREMILGGVTEYMLEHADIPLLLSH